MKNQVNYNRPVGIIDGELYLVNYTFEDGNFVGVTGSHLAPLSQRYVDERNDPDEIQESLKGLWKEAVEAERYEDSLEQFVKDVIAESDGLFPFHDDSDTQYVTDEIKDKYFPGAVGFECTGGGRCFTAGMKWDVIIDRHLVDEINRLEKPEVSK